MSSLIEELRTLNFVGNWVKGCLVHYASVSGKGSDHKSLLYVALPCIFARGYFHSSKPRQPGYMATTLPVISRPPSCRERANKIKKADGYLGCLCFEF